MPVGLISTIFAPSIIYHLNACCPKPHASAKDLGCRVGGIPVVDSPSRFYGPGRGTATAGAPLSWAVPIELTQDKAPVGQITRGFLCSCACSPSSARGGFRYCPESRQIAEQRYNVRLIHRLDQNADVVAQYLHQHLVNLCLRVFGADGHDEVGLFDLVVMENVNKKRNLRKAEPTLKMAESRLLRIAHGRHQGWSAKSCESAALRSTS